MLEFSLMLRDKIEKTGKYRVVMTRTDDTFVPLAERVQHRARAPRPSLFISIHADALARGDGDAQGATVYTLSERASDAAAARLAEAENRADVIAGLDLSAEPDDVADILIDLAQRETKTFSVQFARALVGELRNAAAHAQESAEVGRLPGAQGAGRALGAGRARLCVEQGGPQVADLGGVAGTHGRRDRAGDRYLLHDPRWRGGQN